MNFLNSLLFLLLLLAFLWTIKADLFFMIFGTVILLYFITQMFFMDPLEILFSVGEFFLLNPFGVFILFIPLMIYGIYWGIRKISNSKKGLC